MGGINKIRLVISYYPFEIPHSFLFYPRLFKAGGATRKAIEALSPLLERFLDQALKGMPSGLPVFIEQKCSSKTFSDPNIPLLGTVREETYVRFSRNVGSIGELRGFYEAASRYLREHCSLANKVAVEFSKPVEIFISPPEMRRIFEALMGTDALLNVETARALFGKSFAEAVSEHNRAIRSKVELVDLG